MNEPDLKIKNLGKKLKIFFESHISILTGIKISPSVIFVSYMLPWIFVQFFKIGLKGLSAIIVFSCLPFMLLIYLLFWLKPHKRIKFGEIFGLILIPLLCIFGLIVIFGINQRDLPGLVLIDLIIILGFYCAVIDLQTILRRSSGNNEIDADLISPKTQPKSFLHGTYIGISIIVGIVAIGWIIFPQIEFLPFTLAVLYGFHAVVLQFEQKSESELEQNPKPELEQNPKHKILEFLSNTFIMNLLLFLQLLGLLIIWVFQGLIPFYATAEYEYNGYGWLLLGIAAGIFIFAWEKKHIRIIYAFIYLGLIGLYSLFWLNYKIFLTPYGLILDGLFFGITSAVLIQYFVENFRKYRTAFSRGNEVILYLIVLIAFGLLVHEIKFVVLDYPQSFWMFPIIAIGASSISISLISLSRWLKSRFKDKFTHSMNKIGGIEREQWSKRKKRNKYIRIETWLRSDHKYSKKLLQKKMMAIFLIIFCCSSFSSFGLYSKSKAYVHINLGRVMYTVNGNPVTSIDLKEETGKILLYSPHPTVTNGTESIRPGKTIRLGAYLYDASALGNCTPIQARDWIAHNFDVFALGGYLENIFYPDDIQAIKNINNQSRFYIMTFGTTLGENDTWSVDGALAPCTKWNSTMESWTLKTKEGTEAIGVRHSSPNSTAHLMDLGNMGWADYYAMIWNNRVKAYHADGVAIDEIMWNGYWGTNINDLQKYSSISQITDTCYQWLARIHSRMNVQIISQAFWDQAQQYQNGIWGELAFRCGGAYGSRVDDQQAVVWYNSMDWQQIVQNMYKYSSLNESYIWAAWYKQNDTESLEYAVSTYLMGKANNSTSLVFAPQPVYNGGYPYNLAGYSFDTVRHEIENHPDYFNLELGNAHGPMHLVDYNGGKVWEREFDNGIVYVNPYHAYIPGFDAPTGTNPSY